MSSGELSSLLDLNATPLKFTVSGGLAASLSKSASSKSQCCTLMYLHFAPTAPQKLSHQCNLGHVRSDVPADLKEPVGIIGVLNSTLMGL